MKSVTWKLTSIGLAVLLNGCMTNDQGQTVLDPEKVNTFVSAMLTTNGQGKDSDGGSGADDDAYTPAPNDQYVAKMHNNDAIVEQGNTYLVTTDPGGVRHRVLYGHGDLRADAIARREHLQHVIARNGGALPNHPIIASGDSAAKKGVPPGFHGAALGSPTSAQASVQGFHGASLGSPISAQARQPSGSPQQHIATAPSPRNAVAQPTKTTPVSDKKDQKKTS